MIITTTINWMMVSENLYPTHSYVSEISDPAIICYAISDDMEKCCYLRF